MYIRILSVCMFIDIFICMHVYNHILYACVQSYIIYINNIRVCVYHCKFTWNWHPHSNRPKQLAEAFLMWQAQRKTERVLRQLEAGGAVARAALRRLLLSRMTLEERVAKVREEMGIPLESIGSYWIPLSWRYHDHDVDAGTLYDTTSTSIEMKHGEI